MLKNLPEFYGLNCTINTTEDCNLRCKYCYEINKCNKTIDLESCKKFIDLVLQDYDFCRIKDTPSKDNRGESIYKSRVFDFIGGDSLMNVDILEEIFRYINKKTALLPGGQLENGWRASISTNGTLFERSQVRAFCEKWKDNLHVGVSIDGCPEIHDMNRVFPDGTGSMSTIMKWWPWYKKTFPTAALSTKATCARSTIPYLYDSLVWMHETLGLKYINQNFIMEDTGCTEEDYKLLDEQLEKCTYYVLDHCDEMYWAMISDTFIPEDQPESNFYTEGRCGSGCMPALSIDGNIYPCFRWLPHTQQGGVGAMCVGNIRDGFNQTENFVKVSCGAIRNNCTKDPKCRECEYEPCCSYCIGGCYAEYGDFIRTTHICEIIKLQCKWARIYKKLYEEKCKKFNYQPEAAPTLDELTLQKLSASVNNSKIGLDLDKLPSNCTKNELSNIFRASLSKLINGNFLTMENNLVFYQ